MTDAQPDDARRAVLCQCGEGDVVAAGLDRNAANIPANICDAVWRLRDAFPLGVQEAMPISMAPEPVLRGIEADGYFVWRRGSIHGTSQ